MTYLAYLGLMLIVGVTAAIVSAVLDNIHPQATREFFRLVAMGLVLTACWKALTGRYVW